MTHHTRTAEPTSAPAPDPATDRVLRICRANWEYRGLDDASVREMLAELAAHLEDAGAAGRSPEEIVGKDVRAFAASWARARAPLHRRALRTTALGLFVLGALILLSFLVRRTTHQEMTVERVTFFAVFGVIAVAWELRRGTLSLLRGWLAAFLAALSTALLTHLLPGDKTLFTLPLWAAALIVLPGLPYAYADLRAKRAASAAKPGEAGGAGEPGEAEVANRPR
ncbi:hypothetical protein SLNWT_4742 [Streptomyces albus]|uniref:Uncharacterized protein n=1 Tax=Streptomyces albus (strain ATCC 21838 / DSM 41398 / FERM P-419 / JCM 4703 / NBRC 107858) TaxID=1081613 RepID=A0A0B5EQQ7_STRA4|nr:hypothetical protein SLNWT_4742 [Streptomyces albus]AOU79425.1 hypothetical protein SLNHY_4734 [Streptomyces albus]AYN35151.1 hypothetical protein DUI70_4653 [Streptomyces albus]